MKDSIKFSSVAAGPSLSRRCDVSPTLPLQRGGMIMKNFIHSYRSGLAVAYVGAVLQDFRIR